MANDFNITGNLSKTLTEIWWRWDNPAIKMHISEGCVECRFLLKNPYDNPGRLYSLEYSIDNGVTRYSATVLPDKGIADRSFKLNAKTTQMSVWWFAGYDLRIMKKFESVKLYAKFCEDLTGDQTEEREVSVNIDLRPSGYFSVISPRSNDRYFNLKFVSKETVIPGILHYSVEIDKVDSFDSEDLQVLSTQEAPLQWTCDGGVFPAEGVMSNQNHVIEYISDNLGTLVEDDYYYRISADYNQFYPVITYPADGQVFIGETIDVVGHVVILDETVIDKYEDINDDTTFTDVIPAGYKLDYILFNNDSGQVPVLYMGTVSEGNNVIDEYSVSNGVSKVEISTIFSSSVDTTLYLSDNSSTASWNNAMIDVTFVMKKNS